MLYLYRFIIRLSIAALLLGLSGCAGEFIEEDFGFYDPDSPEATALRNDQAGDDENLGPNAPGYLGPDGEYSLYPDNDPR